MQVVLARNSRTQANYDSDYNRIGYNASKQSYSIFLQAKTLTRDLIVTANNFGMLIIEPLFKNFIATTLFYLKVEKI